MAKTKRSHEQEVLHSSRSSIWYTPRPYTAAVTRLFGDRIDLDPASDLEANGVVQARRFFDGKAQGDGLAESWANTDGSAATVFLNPPYGRVSVGGKLYSAQKVWLDKTFAEYEVGHVRAAILLLNNATERKWFQRLWDYPICFTDHRIAFWEPGGRIAAQPNHGSVFVYLPPRVGQPQYDANLDLFASVFATYGEIVTSVRRGWQRREAFPVLQAPKLSGRYEYDAEAAIDARLAAGDLATLNAQGEANAR